jgi:hypothetical protein
MADFLFNVKCGFGYYENASYACAVPYYHNRYTLPSLPLIDGFKIDERP